MNKLIKKTAIFFCIIFLNLLNAEENEYLENRNQTLHFMKFRNTKKNLFEKPYFDSKSLINLKLEATGEIKEILKSDVNPEGLSGYWLYVTTRNKTGYLFSANDLYITTSDLLNTERPKFDPSVYINLPDSFEPTNLNNIEKLIFLPLQNNFSVSFISNDDRLGKVLLKNNKTRIFYTFEQSNYFIKNSYENTLIFNGIKKSCDNCEIRHVTLLLFKNKIFELEFSFQNSEEYFEWVEGYQTPFNEVRIIPEKIIFLYHEEFKFTKRNSSECAEYDLNFYEKCLIKEKYSDYFLAIKNYNEEPIFDYYENEGIPRKYLIPYTTSRKIKEDNK
ncbi:hypothetical protein EHQ26_09595 [Leptospira bourretii]|uniref:SH3 domain-containing protein n=1 Tax=Leptospira bourretii TaxID=2484962 RepID=A0ABY2LGX6_9LEPT|nr:hypothetical protein [Leptospira bourretii]TGK92220.1 hypothetical protein EHQ26_09595 [Leptospira bourretii]